MPWQEVSTMLLRQEFVTLAMQQGANVRELCRRFGVSPKNGYKWLGRHTARGSGGLADQSRRPNHSPMGTNLQSPVDNAESGPYDPYRRCESLFVNTNEVLRGFCIGKLGGHLC